MLAGWLVEGEAHSDLARGQDTDRAFLRLGQAGLGYFVGEALEAYYTDLFRDLGCSGPSGGFQQKRPDGHGAIVIRASDGVRASLGVEICHSRSLLLTVSGRHVWKARMVYLVLMAPLTASSPVELGIEMEAGLIRDQRLQGRLALMIWTCCCY